MPAPYEHTRLTEARLRELLEYNPKDGSFMWLKTRSWRARAGDEAGTIRKDGHKIIIIDGVSQMAPRLAWLYMMGTNPPGRLLTNNGDNADTRWSNIVLESDRYKPNPKAAYQRTYRLKMKALRDGKNPDLVPFDKHNPADPRNPELYKAWIQEKAAMKNKVR